MNNKPFDIFHYADATDTHTIPMYAAKHIFTGEKISDDELETLVENKLEYLEYLISIAPKKLALRPLKD